MQIGLIDFDQTCQPGSKCCFKINTFEVLIAACEKIKMQNN